MGTGIAVLTIIIIINLIVIISVLYFGSQHDEHQNTNSIESSTAASMAIERAKARAAKLQALQAEQLANDVQETASEES